ncbi:uncharacterized protein M6B38_391780 [Iris pallida]|uniref:Uncharacterized protein n=1 Tax=Iris pallida TaxID=29817 RepID=A0AAX6FZ70_IRIPA|nr:uncharacterized protein M6B38_391775 [Iris pallida]KAJ6821583.1 uncharacterized protein M6B38_391780 [Iris pallida]
MFGGGSGFFSAGGDGFVEVGRGWSRRCRGQQRGSYVMVDGC